MAEPKSIRRAEPLSSIIKLAVFRSRCTTPAEWTAPTAEHVSRANLTT